MAHLDQPIIELGEDDKIIVTGKSARYRIRRDNLGRQHPRSDEIIAEDNRLINLADIIIRTRSLQRETRSQRVQRLQREEHEARQAREAREALKSPKTLVHKC